MKKTCPSVDPKDGTKCGQPAGHYGRCSNGVGHRSWEYNVPQKAVDMSLQEEPRKLPDAVPSVFEVRNDRSKRSR